MVDPKNPAKVLRYAMENAGDDLRLYPCLPHTVGLSRACKAKGSRPARRATITVEVPDETVENLRTPETADLLMFVLVPRRVLDRAELGLVLPGQRRG